MSGQIAGDFVKGPHYAQDIHPGVAAGIAKHRAIDSFCDGHPAVRHAKTFFPSPARRCAGVVLDLVFDHLLSRHWSSYCAHSRRDFLAYASANLYHEAPLWPLPMQRFTEHMLREGWLDSYVDWYGVVQACARLAKGRAQHLPLSEALQIAEQHFKEIELLFQSLMPDLMQHFSSEDGAWRAP